MRRVALGATVALLALAFSASGASATYPGANGRIAFSLVTGDPYTGDRPPTIRTILSDGTDPQNLGPGSDPSWSANGKRIAFIRAGDVFVMDADGSNVQRVTRTPERFESSPSFGPAGQRIVYSRVAGANSPVIGSIALDGSDYKRLALGSDPEFSPDGTHIVYDFGEIWLMRRDGTGQHQLNGVARRYLSLGFSPDGQRLLFSWCRDDWCLQSGTKTISTDGANKDWVCSGFGATYSPNGSDFAYWQPVNDTGGDPRIYSVSNIWTTTFAQVQTDCDRHQLTNYQRLPGRHFATEPAWQPLPTG